MPLFLKREQVFTFDEQRILNMIDDADQKLRTVVLNAFTSARFAPGDLDNLARLIEQGRVNEAIDNASRVAGLRIADGYAAVYTLAGEETSAAMEDALDIVVGFDRTNYRAVNHMQRERLRLISDFTSHQREATREALVDGIRRGINPREQARAFRDSIGLTQFQQRAVFNFRNLLQGANSGSQEALTRALRDRRFDPSIRAAIEGRRALTENEISRMVDRYRERYIKYRSVVIARTEAMRSVHAGSEEAFEQAADEGEIDRGEIRRTWITAGDHRVRDSHVALNGIERGMNETFPAWGGPLRYPGDPRGAPSEVIQCRCAIATRIKRKNE